jgi:triacylglycerol lipase
MLAVLVLMVAVAITFVLVASWRAEQAARRAPEAPAIGAPAIVRASKRPAVVLAHGILGFDALALGPLRVAYFRRVAESLDAAGIDVIAARVPALGGVPARGDALARFIEALPHDRVKVIGHSMGGLDARWAIARGATGRISDLITIGTPHRGTPIADLLARGPVERARSLLARLGLPSDAVDWLSTWRLARFAHEAPDAPGVRYACVVAATADRARVHPLLRPTHAYLSLIDGPNDGLVPASSQRWGEVLAEEEVDHWAQVGWSGGHDAGDWILRSTNRRLLRPPTVIAARAQSPSL